MNVEIGSELKKHPDFAQIARDASPILEEEIGPSSARVTAAWEYATDGRNRPAIRLAIRDWTGETSTDFAPDDLRQPDHARRRFYRLWGDLLQAAANRAMDALAASSSETAGN